MFASVLSVAILGLDVRTVVVEADASDGLPCFTMVGFPSTQVKEAQERVRTALQNNGIELTPRRITVNLAPADLRKEGATYDLPLAAVLLAVHGLIDPMILESVMMAGELSLNGEVHGISGVLPMVMQAREEKCRYCMIPYENLREGMLVKGIQVIGVRNILEAIHYMNEPDAYEAPDLDDLETTPESTVDFRDVHGQRMVKRACEIAASGFHNLLMIGPPGAGKTMIARRMATIMPELTFEESLELTKIYSVVGLLSQEHPLVRERPFRNPHHTSSPLALAGGGRIPRPGEITLAHRGVLFLDEMPEFSRGSLEIMRQPLEDRVIQIARVHGTYQFPANFILCAAMNPCPCGFYPDMNRCHCSAGEVERYMGRISKPLLDRMDLCVDVSPVTYEDLQARSEEESSADIRRRVERVHEIQRIRYEGEKVHYNGELNSRQIEQYCPLSPSAEKVIRIAFKAIACSARSYHRIMKVARTIADLDESEIIEEKHMKEALFYRAFDKK